jgi:hypothetical protein
MPTGGSYAHLLRALGQTLDQQRAHNIKILEHEVFLKVSYDLSWEDPEGHHQESAYHEFDLQELAEQAKQHRGAVPGAGEQGERLRTLGQELDAAGITLGSIEEDRANYRVRGTAHGRYVDQVYRFADLRALSGERHRLRRPDAPAPTVPTPLPGSPRWQFWRRRAS